MNDQAWEWQGLDHAGAATLLADHFPVRGGSHLEPLGQGDFCLAFKYGGQIIRVARHGVAARAIQREAAVLAQIATLLPLPVPHPVCYAPPACPPFTIHDEVVGAVLTRERWESLAVEAREQVADNLASFLRTLHALPPEIGLACGLARLDSAAIADSLRRGAAATIYRFLDRETRRRLDDALASWSIPSSIPGRGPSLLHCDIAPGHLLYDPGTDALAGVIDFGDLAVGDPARDFIYLYEDFGATLLAEVLSRYAGADAPGMMAEIRKWYLLETIGWTIAMSAAECVIEVQEGLDEIMRELAGEPTW
jgi:aminoglycoside 2''-phosphotransferase